MNAPKLTKPRLMQTTYDRTVKFKDCISKVTLPDMTTATSEQLQVVNFFIKWEGSNLR